MSGALRAGIKQEFSLHLIFSLCVFVRMLTEMADQQSRNMLSSMSKEQLLQFIKDKGNKRKGAMHETVSF